MDPKWKKRLAGGLLLVAGAVALKKTGVADKAASAAAGVIGTAMAYIGGKAVGQIQLVVVDGKKAELQTARQFIAMRQAAARDGVTLKLSSGFRTMEEQEALYQKYLNGTGNLAAKPGTSNHQNGVALDIAVNASFTSPQYLWLEKNAAKFGFENTGKNFSQQEPWHWERKRVVNVAVPDSAFAGVSLDEFAGIGQPLSDCCTG